MGDTGEAGKTGHMGEPGELVELVEREAPGRPAAAGRAVERRPPRSPTIALVRDEGPAFLERIEREWADGRLPTLDVIAGVWKRLLDTYHLRITPYSRRDRERLTLRFNAQTPHPWLRLDYEVRLVPVDALPGQPPRYAEAFSLVGRVSKAALRLVHQGREPRDELLGEGVRRYLGNAGWDGLLFRYAEHEELLRSTVPSAPLPQDGLRRLGDWAERGVTALGLAVHQAADHLADKRTLGAPRPPYFLVPGEYVATLTRTLVAGQPALMTLQVERGDEDAGELVDIVNRYRLGELLEAGRAEPPNTVTDGPAPLPPAASATPSRSQGASPTRARRELVAAAQGIADQFRDLAVEASLAELADLLAALVADARGQEREVEQIQRELVEAHEALMRSGRAKLRGLDDAPWQAAEAWARQDCPLVVDAPDPADAHLVAEARQCFLDYRAKRPVASALRGYAYRLCAALHDGGHAPAPDPDHGGTLVCPRCGERVVATGQTTLSPGGAPQTSAPRPPVRTRDWIA